MKNIFILLFIIFYFKSFSQEIEYVKTNNARESLQFAQDLVAKGEFAKAERQLAHTLKIKPDFAVAYRELGTVLLELSRYAEATIAYEKSFEYTTEISRAAYFECGEAYFKSDDTEKALYYYKKYTDLKDKNYANKKKESALELAYDKVLPMRLNNCEYVLHEAQSGPPFAYAKNLGPGVNSERDEYLPTVVSSGQRLVFTRKGKYTDEDIYVSELDKDSLWQNARKIGRDINTARNEGMAKYAAHGKTFYFAGCERKDTEGGCDVYEAHLANGEVDSISRLDGINSSFWDSQPSISCNADKMFFASTRPGGLGGADIWMCEKKANGDWATAVNLGPTINTPYDEESPFIANDGKTLYFASNGHPGQGDGDFFISRFIDGAWTEAQNLGKPFNTQSKELGIYIQGDGQTAFFASSRFGSQGGLDLYTTILPPELRPLPMIQLEGHIMDAATEQPIQTKLSIHRLGDSWTLQSDESGWFFICLEGNRGYTFQVDNPNYEYYMTAVFLPGSDNLENTQTIIKLLPLSKVPQRPASEIVPPKPPNPIKQETQEETAFNSSLADTKRVLIFFDFDSADLNDLGVSALDMVGRTILKDPAWKVEVVGYADSSGNSEYNKKLSEKRADNVVGYLKKLGVTIQNVIKKEGKGSLAAATEEEKRMSRRVEVVMRK
jgi:outer membrane protein OmpA-like peptidoglycan-associated protein/tetratricopeptide (TPR) repeat protein